MAIRVMLVDDSALIRRLLAKVLGVDPEIEVVAHAQNGQMALDRLDDADPDVVVLDIEMPVMDGLQALAHLKRRRPNTPVIMFSTLTERGASATLEALTRGADDYITKPSNTGSFERTSAEIQQSLIPRMKALVETARRRPARRTLSSIAPVPARELTTRTAPATPRLSKPRRTGLFRPRAVLIGVSTGGPDALNVVVPALPPSLPVPVFITQHMPPIFTKLLADRLDQVSDISVSEGQAGVRPEGGQVWLAPGGQHMLIQRNSVGRITLALDDGPPVQSCKPAADPMFTSAVDAYDGEVLAVMLTGMGADGHHGCERVRDAGGMVVCQDEATSVVWGMPGVVARAGLAEKIVPLDRIAPTIVEATRLSTSTTSPALT